MRVCFETFGCRLNKAEALQMEAEYLAKGWTVTDKHSLADLIIVRGCSVTSRAERDCKSLVAHLRHHYPRTTVKVCGCLSAKMTDKALENVAERVLRRQESAAETSDGALPTRTSRAYLKVQDGCAGRCTFCIVPKFRGASRSEGFDGLLDKARRFIDAGYHEIVVTGCNLSLYASQGKRLPDLIAALADITPDCRIRLGSLEPGPCAVETVRSMSEHVNVCRFLHLPIQSGSNAILNAMRRPYTSKDVEDIVSLASSLMPNLGLGCDVMTGFPGESAADFALTFNLINKLPFTNAHVFPFSKRSETIAAALDGQVPKDIRHERANRISDLVKKLRRKYAATFIGKTVEIIVESDKKCTGRTSEYLVCEALGKKVTRKSSVRILVNKVQDDKLFGLLA